MRTVAVKRTELVIHPFLEGATTMLVGIALTLGPNSLFFFLKITIAGSFVPSAKAHNATVKPFLSAPVVAILMLCRPLMEFVKEGAESNLEVS